MYKRGVVISGVVSLTMGNSPLPFGNRFVRNIEPLSQLFLGKPFFFAAEGHKAAELRFINRKHRFIPLSYRVSERMIPDFANLRNRRRVELGNLPADFAGNPRSRGEITPPTAHNQKRRWPRRYRRRRASDQKSRRRTGIDIHLAEPWEPVFAGRQAPQKRPAEKAASESAFHGCARWRPPFQT